MAIKLLRKMAVIEIPQPKINYNPGKTVDTRGAKFPLSGATAFIQAVEALDGSPKRQRFLILEKHNELFLSYPTPGVAIEVARARCVYRLQFLGQQQTGIKPSEKFLQNYNAMMKFSESEPWEGCTRNVAELGKLVSLTSREVAMSTVNQAKSAAKKVAKAAKPAKPATEKRGKILGKYSVTGIITWLSKQFDVSCEQIDIALKKLGSHSTPKTIRTYQRPGIKLTLKVEPSDIPKLKAAIPAASKPKAEAKPAAKAAPKKVVATPKPVAKKIIKKISKPATATATA
jgi:hypothetical protein